MNTENISIKVANEYVEQLSAKYGLTDQTKTLLLNQMNILKLTYGAEYVPKKDFLEVIGRQVELTRSGYIRKPVDMSEFLLGVEYLNLAHTIRPIIRDELIRLFDKDTDCNEVCLYGATRIGKTYFSCAGLARIVYNLSCLANPQTHFSLSPNSEIVIIFQSVNEIKAKRNFSEFKGLIEASPYFKKYFPPQGKARNYTRFPHNIVVKPAASNNTAIMSENVIAGFLDELSFMKVVKGSRMQGSDDQYYDQATQLYGTLKSRVENQFGDAGKLFLASSANHVDDFLNQKKEEAKENKKIYFMSYALWEVKEDMQSEEKFWVRMPDEQQAGKIFDEKPDIEDDKIIEVPMKCRPQFDRNLISAIKDVAGIPLDRTSKFIPSDVVFRCIKEYAEHFEGQQIFTTQEVNINEVYSLDSLFNMPFIEAIKNHYTFHAHVDMAISHCSAGIAVGATVGSKEVPLVDEESDEPGQTVVPIYASFGLLRINPPDQGEIDLEKVEFLFCRLKELLPRFRSMTADRRLSERLFQVMRKNGVVTDVISVDRHPEPYVETKISLSEGRVWLPDHEKFKEEIKYLRQDAESGKISTDHLHSKDCADAVAGMVYKLSKRKETWAKKSQTTPAKLGELRKLNNECKEKEEETAPKVERPSSGNRPHGWGNRSGSLGRYDKWARAMRDWTDGN